MSKRSKLFLLVVMIVVCIVSFMQFNLFSGKAQDSNPLDEAKILLRTTLHKEPMLC